MKGDILAQALMFDDLHHPEVFVVGVFSLAFFWRQARSAAHVKDDRYHHREDDGREDQIGQMGAHSDNLPEHRSFVQTHTPLHRLWGSWLIQTMFLTPGTWSPHLPDR